MKIINLYAYVYFAEIYKIRVKRTSHKAVEKAPHTSFFVVKITVFCENKIKVFFAKRKFLYPK